MYFDSENHHLALRPTCAACHSAVLANESVRALLSNADSTAHDGLTRSFPFPPLGMQPPTQDYILCRKPGCSVCMRSPEAFTVHSDCLLLYHRRCGALPRLWTLAAWKNTWRTASSIGFSSPSSSLYLDRLFEVAPRLMMPWIRKLPLEVVTMIRTFSTDALLWKYVAVLGTIDYISASRPQEILKKTISQIYRWERGSPIQHTSQLLPIVRLCIDSWGIKRLERFATISDLSADTGGCSAFIVEDEATLRDVVAEFMDGLLRLKLPRGHYGLDIWDTPCPPARELCQFYPIGPMTARRLRTITLLETTGLTFFCKGGRVYGIHGHTSNAPSALLEFRKLPERLRRFIVWVYLPLPREENIQAFNVSVSSDLVIQTTSKIVYRIGPWTHDPGEEEVTVRCTDPKTLLFNEPDTGTPISTIGMACDPKDKRPVNNTVQLHTPYSPLRQDDIYYSFARLDHVKVARVFYDQDTCYCKGILFVYADGSEQAVGQCGFDFFQEQTFESPELFYYRRESLRLGQALEIKFATKSTKDSTWVGWLGSAMEGTVEFWYNYHAIIMFEKSIEDIYGLCPLE